MSLRRVLIALLLAAALTTASNAQQPKPERQDEFVPISELPPEEQLPAQPLVIGAYAFAWLALGGYVLSIARRLDHVQREIERLETETKRSR
jgi:CcmD family protein